METYGSLLICLFVGMPTAFDIVRPMKRVVLARHPNITLENARRFTREFTKANTSINPDRIECTWQVAPENWSGNDVR